MKKKNKKMTQKQHNEIVKDLVLAVNKSIMKVVQKSSEKGEDVDLMDLVAALVSILSHHVAVIKNYKERLECYGLIGQMLGQQIDSYFEDGKIGMSRRGGVTLQ